MRSLEWLVLELLLHVKCDRTIFLAHLPIMLPLRQSQVTSNFFWLIIYELYMCMDTHTYTRMYYICVLYIK